ncbi:MAG: methyltransferase domain-containing protein [Melioribacteraceae bacterium]|nr:methyltransferase domain-containing protein [Melioribacteraceae bacterium]MCF8353664.1 methyltransferase domain-containing protein [Melioribacteraceae bacterium]MCF8393434.1 methyltransferase domain-containing protein [Melioribacteraceae bacterium]MCF8419291.1 methyltransferase domain-containing protein [Melioribacteraceae bacterium]
MGFDEYYKSIENAFGSEPEKILTSFHHLIQKDYPVLDIGAGQGRNSIHLADLGYEVDAIDPSPVSVLTIDETCKKLNLRVNTFHSGFIEFKTDAKYSAILLFGLMQILTWEQIEILKDRLTGWLLHGGLLFVTSFTTDDNGFKNIKKTSEQIGRNSFRKTNSEIRTHFEPGELQSIFNEYEIIHYCEGLGPEHRHGDNPPERHAMVEAVFRKNR